LKCIWRKNPKKSKNSMRSSDTAQNRFAPRWDGSSF
jgi:hypothetical protein